MPKATPPFDPTGNPNPPPPPPQPATKRPAPEPTEADLKDADDKVRNQGVL